MTQARSGRGRRGATLKIVGVGLALAALAGVAYAIAAGKSGSGRRGQGQSGVDIVSVSKMSFDISTTATGELQAKSQIELSSELESEASLMELVAEGMQVKQGDLLFRLNTDQIQTQVDETMLRVESSTADMVAAENTVEIQRSENDSKVRQAQLKLDVALLALDQWAKGEQVQKRKDIELALDKTEKDLARLEEKYKDSVKLNEEGFLSRDQMQQDEIALREAKAARQKAVLEQTTYENYQQPKDKKTKESDVTEAAAELERVKQQATIQLAIKEADRVNKKRTLALHEEKLAKLQRQLAAATVTAPQDGLVVYASSAGKNFFDDSPFAVGRRVRPQEPLIVLPDTSVMVAAVRVHESLAGRVRPGQQATVKIDSFPGRTFVGEVDSIGVMAESQGRWSDPNRREYTIKIAIDKVGPDVNLKPAMRCEAVITLGRVEDVQAVPLQAIFNDEMVRFVYTPEGSKFVRVPVQVGRRSETLAEISAGLSDGQRVLVREPIAGEVLDSPWDESKLKLVGLQIGADGKPMPIGGARAGEGERPRRRPEGGGNGQAGRRGPREGGGPGGRTPDAKAPGATPGDSKPAETKPTETANTGQHAQADPGNKN